MRLSKEPAWRLLGLIALGVFVPVAACSVAGSESDESKGGDPTIGLSFGAGGTSAGNPETPPVDADAPEVELEESFRAPVVFGEYLWSANPDTNKVARVNASTLEIEVLEAGHAPTYVAALPEGATRGGALVLNTKSRDASFFLVNEQGGVEGEARIAVQEGASAWAVGEKGNFAVAWSRSTDALLNGSDGYQDLTVLDFRAENIETTGLSVGFRPNQVFISADETRAFVVSDPGISVIELDDGVHILRELFLPDQEGARDVVFSKDGSLAIVRIAGSSELLLIETETNERVAVELPGVVTDLDLSEEGEIAVAVVRSGQTATLGQGGAGGAEGMNSEESVVALLSLETIFDEPAQFELFYTDEVVGSAVVANDASQVLLFTNATANTHFTVLSVESGEMRTMDLKAPVQAAFISEDAAHAVALMTPPLGSIKAGAFALIPVKEQLSPRIVGTDTAPKFVSISAEAGRALVTTAEDSNQKATTFFGHFPELVVDTIELPSRPLASGIVAEAGQAFVAQAHPEGRVTFIALESGVEKTVTGFELTSKVVE